MLNKIYNFGGTDIKRVTNSSLHLDATHQSSNRADTSTIGVSAFFIAQNAIGVDRTPELRRDRSHGYIVLNMSRMFGPFYGDKLPFYRAYFLKAKTVRIFTTWETVWV